MARKKKSGGSGSGDIPMWFMTYSDVITLLMTFFILLLTFATDEPEVFKKMKTSMFGGKGSVGIASSEKENFDRESLTVRLRPKLGRKTQRGTETPPMHSEVVSEAMDDGIRSLSEESDLARFDRMTMEASAAAFMKDDDTLTSTALHHIKLLAFQMKRMPIDATFEVSSEKYVPLAIQMADILTTELKVPTGRIGVALVTDETAPRDGLRITVSRQEN